MPLTIIFTESCEHSSGYTEKWNVQGNNYYSASGARTGSRCIILNGSRSEKQLKAADEHATLTIAAAVNRAASGFNFQFTSDSRATTHVQISVGTDGTITAYRGAGTTVLGASATGVYSQSAYNHIECRVTLHDTAGSVDVRVNSISVLSLSNIDTKNGGTKAVFDSFCIGGGNNSQSLDDLIVAKDAAAGEFIGDCRVFCLYPTGDGTTRQLTGVGTIAGTGAGTWQNVDEPQANTTDYNGSAIDEQYDTYTYGNLPTPSSGIYTVKAVNVQMHAAKSDTGSRGLAPVVRSGGSEYTGTSQALNTSYQNYHEVLNLNPITGVAWTAADVDAAEFGVKVKAS